MKFPCTHFSISASMALLIILTYVSCGDRANLGSFSSTKETSFRVSDDSLAPDDSVYHPANNVRLVWISLDGLKKETLERFLARERQNSNKGSRLHPYGIKYLLETKGPQAQVRISDPTITASSHASTMTCATAGTHGIVNNVQWNGTGEESGFETPYATETFVHALRKTGLRVGVSGYPGFDSKTQNRTPDFGISYARTEGAAAQFVDLSNFSNGSPFPVQINLTSKQSIEQREIGLKYSSNDDLITILNDDGKPMGQVTSEKWTKISFDVNGSTWASSLRIFHNPELPQASATLYISPALRNAVVPSELQEKLDQSNAIFPFGKDFALAARFGEQAFIDSLEPRLNYFTKTSHALLDQPGLDALFLYFEDLDVLGHRYEGDESKLNNVDVHLRRFDHALGSILQRINAKTNVIITGDHGMSAIQFELNVLQLIPNNLKSGLQIRAAGGSLFVYGPDADSLRQDPPKTKEFAQLVDWLRSARVPGNTTQNLFTKVLVKGSKEASDASWKDGVPLPWIHATTQPEIGMVASVEPRVLTSLRKGIKVPAALLDLFTGGMPLDLLPQPKSLGQHGHASEDPQMRTRLFAWGPALTDAFRGIRAQNASPQNVQGSGIVMNTELVPLVADALALPRPESCR